MSIILLFPPLATVFCVKIIGIPNPLAPGHPDLCQLVKPDIKSSPASLPEVSLGDRAEQAKHQGDPSFQKLS